MRPIKVAKQLYLENDSTVPFEKALWLFCTSPGGFVISTPIIFAMGYTSEYKYEPEWVVDTAVGRLPQLVAAMPFKLPYIAFKRHKRDGGAKIKHYALERFLRLVKKT